MRLVNTSSRTLEEFTSRIPDYAILSHTWRRTSEGSEVLYADVIEGRAERMAGYDKLKNACELARKDGFKYIWVDTCCINRNIDSELQISLNSMYQWYQNARVCYAYLADVPSSGVDFDDPQGKFHKSRWFTRGWTLQELIVPQSLIFLGSDWKEIGTKSSLQDPINAITRIPHSVLLIHHAEEINIACRMSWAANRELSRIEDTAYSLLGLFGISMPTIYGEGANAFLRLQEELMKTSNDQTLLAWTRSSGSPPDAESLFACSPNDFASIDDLEYHNYDGDGSPYTLTNNGLQIKLHLQPAGNIFKAFLKCRRHHTKRPVGIFLKKVRGKINVYERTRLGELCEADELLDKETWKTRTEVFIKHKDPVSFNVRQWMRPQNNYVFCVTKLPADFKQVGVYPRDSFTGEGEQTRLTMPTSGQSGALIFQRNDERFAVVMGVHNYNVWCDVEGDVTETVDDFQHSYYEQGEARYNMLWKNWDRATATLKSGTRVSVIIRRTPGETGGDWKSVAEITVVNK